MGYVNNLARSSFNDDNPTLSTLHYTIFFGGGGGGTDDASAIRTSA